MGEFGVLCSKMAAKLIIGGCTYLGKDTEWEALTGGQPHALSSQCPEPPGCPAATVHSPHFRVQLYTHWMVSS